VFLKKDIIIQNLRIVYYQNEDFDKNNALVFLHGWGNTPQVFDNLLNKYHNSMAVGLPGFGGSEPPRQAWFISDYANFLKQFLEKLRINAPILIGHSFGGSVIIKHCAYNKNAKRIILINSAGIRRKGIRIFLYLILTKIFKIVFLIPGIALFKNKIRKKFYSYIEATDYLNIGISSLKETFQNITKEDLSEDMKKIETKTTLIWGEKDQTTPLKDGLLMQNLIPHAEMFIAREGKHFMFDNEEFNKLLSQQIYDN